MKVLLIIVIIVFVIEITAFKFTQIDEVIGMPHGNPNNFNANFDGEGNIYVAATDRDSSILRLYKLSPSNEVLWSIKIPNYLEYLYYMLVTSRGDIYFSSLISNGTTALAVLWADSTVIHEIDVLWYNYGKFFLDNNDNLFYCKNGSGMHVLQSKASEPTAVVNLENVCAIKMDTDQSGNVYFQLIDEQSSKFLEESEPLPYAIAVVTAEDLQENIPHATFLAILENKNQYPEDFTIDANNNVWITITELVDNTAKKGLIKKLVDGKLEIVVVDEELAVNKLVPAKDKIFVMGSDGQDQLTIYYIASNDEIIAVPELKNLTCFDRLLTGIADSEGYVYFFSPYINFSQSLGSYFFIKPDEMVPIPITFDKDVHLFKNSPKFDFNEDVWMMDNAHYMYYLKKGQTIPKQVRNDIADCDIIDVFINFITKRNYAGCYKGLFIVESD